VQDKPSSQPETVILCVRGGRPVTAFDLDQAARFRQFLSLAATPTGRAELRADPAWRAYLGIDTLRRYLDHQDQRESEQAGG
jgi:hypothetical protein